MSKLPNGVDINNLIDNLRIFSWEAAHYMLHYSQLFKDGNYKSNIINKKNEDPVTKADLKVNEIIIKRIGEHYRDIKWGILSEENVKLEKGTCNKEFDWLWVLDPLDGTKDFIQATGNYAMHLALNYKNTPYLGVVLIPEKDELWFAYEDKVWVENKEGTKFKVNLNKNKSLQEMTLVTSKNHRNEALKNLIQKINFKEVMIMGSIGCKIASIVRGESDIYICLSLPGKSCPKDWDFAAPAAILKAAGGAITNINNRELSYNERNFEQGGIIVATNNNLNHRDICIEVKEIIRRFDIYPL
ncbi:MAG: 3'(2'),5'-bisphosphate nucleotidase CysQ [Pseudomonadota bacterium]|nr:MAG: 3'(2'),5'-bisphosphate nucleotidase CysQ [Pseudomonadota bacterium]